MIYQAILQTLTSRPSRKPTDDLYVSEFGQHPYKAMARVLQGEQTKFDTKTLEKMENGTAFENDTMQKLSLAIPNVRTQFPLYDAIWSGYADAVIGHGTVDVTIVEHKATGDKWWDYKGGLVRSTHVCQLWLYGQLYQDMFGITPTLILYYRAWDHHAEFKIVDRGDGLIWAVGEIDGNPVERSLRISPVALQAEIEDLYNLGELPDDEGVESWNYAEDAYDRLLTLGGSDEPAHQ